MTAFATKTNIWDGLDLSFVTCSMNLYSYHNVTSYVDVECDDGSMTVALGIGCDARYLLPGKYAHNKHLFGYVQKFLVSTERLIYKSKLQYNPL